MQTLSALGNDINSLRTDNTDRLLHAGPIAQSVVQLTLVRKVVSSMPTAGRLTQPSIPLWIGNMSTGWMMAIGRICAFQIGSLHQLGNQDMAALVLYAPQGVNLRGGGFSSQRNDTVKGLSQGVKCYCKAPLIR